MRRAASILLLLSITALDTGLMGRLHRAVHHHGDHASPPVSPEDARHDADGPQCQLDVILRAPALSFGTVPTLVYRGVAVAFLTLLAPPLVSARIPPRLDCRGPPRA